MNLSQKLCYHDKRLYSRYPRYREISLEHFMGLSTVYLQKNVQVNILIQYEDMAQKVFVHSLQSVSHLESDLEKNLISFFPLYEGPSLKKENEICLPVFEIFW